MSLNKSLYAAIDHAINLQEKTKSLQSIEMKESKPTEVANRWSNIAKAVKKAEHAANQAFNVCFRLTFKNSILTILF